MKQKSKPSYMREPVEEVIKETVEEVVNGPIVVEEEIEEPVEVEALIGVVDCERLNVRSGSNKNTEPVCVIERGDEVEIDEVNSTEYFYKVTTAAGAEGYCMKKFIKIK